MFGFDAAAYRTVIPGWPVCCAGTPSDSSSVTTPPEASCLVASCLGRMLPWLARSCQMLPWLSQQLPASSSVQCVGLYAFHACGVALTTIGSHADSHCTAWATAALQVS